ncbi:MAG TPA: hypothetical protein VFB03_02865 [Candidatus Saccharimonadales bacterium]|nr:hypothetical protein [Candidatus Saccharimonadales bacterium]
MANYVHNPDFPPIESVIDHRPPRLWLSGVLEVVEVPLEQYEEETGLNVAEFLAEYDQFQKHKRPTSPADPVTKARGFWDVPSEQFDGHFPDLAVLQGVQEDEAIAQLAAYAAAYKQPGQLGVLLGDLASRHFLPVPPDKMLLLGADILGWQKRTFVGKGEVSLANGMLAAEVTASGSVMKKEIQRETIRKAISAIEAGPSK